MVKNEDIVPTHACVEKGNENVYDDDDDDIPPF